MVTTTFSMRWKLGKVVWVGGDSHLLQEVRGLGTPDYYYKHSSKLVEQKEKLSNQINTPPQNPNTTQLINMTCHKT